MQTLLTSAQMRQADEFTIHHKPISAIDLMERAAAAFVQAFTRDETDRHKAITIFCGQGNNGGDGLAIARLLLQEGFDNLQVFVINFSVNQSDDFSTNLKRLKELPLRIDFLEDAQQIKNLETDLIIDAILGSGLNKPLQGQLEAVVMQINQLDKKVYAVDVPTGFSADGPLASAYICIQAFKTICFQRPKINFFFPESAAVTTSFEVVEIGLDEAYIQSQRVDYQLVTTPDIKQIIKPRKPFSHKGTYGHALIIAGAPQTMGAAILNAKGCLYAGAGLTTLSVPESGLTTLNTALPEVMYADRLAIFSGINKYDAIGIGSGLGTAAQEKEMLEMLLRLKRPLVLDADALNLIGNHTELQTLLPKGSVLTPHMKEFDRLFGEHHSWWDRVNTARQQAIKYSCIIVLKNEYTFIINSEGNVAINPTGNPGMAQGGMGDVLTGMITAYLAQGLPAWEAAIAACYLHGLSGDDLAVDHFNVSASQVAENLPKITRHLICSA